MAEPLTAREFFTAFPQVLTDPYIPEIHGDLDDMTADEWNAAFPVGTQVVAYPLTRDDAPLYTYTRSAAWTLGHGAAVVKVEGYAGGILLSHVDPAPDGWELTRESLNRIDVAVDRDGVFAKGYYQPVDGRTAVVGLRIGEKPGHVVAYYGDRVVRRPDGTYTVHAAGGEGR